MGGGLIKGPPISVGGPLNIGLIGAIRDMVETGTPDRLAMLMGGPADRTGNLCIKATWFRASCCLAATCCATDTAMAACNI